MNILIIGRTHFIGPHVVNTLHENDHQITVFHRGETNYPFQFSVNYIKNNRSNLESMKQELSKLSFDYAAEDIAIKEYNNKWKI